MKLQLFVALSTGASINVGKATFQSMETIFRTLHGQKLCRDDSIDEVFIRVLQVDRSPSAQSFPYVSPGPGNVPRTLVEPTNRDSYVWRRRPMVSTSQYVYVQDS